MKIDFDGTAAELVSHLHKASQAKAADDLTWMAETAQRIQLMSGDVIRHDIPENFIADLQTTNHIHRMLTGE